MARKLEDNHSIMTRVDVLRAGRSELQHHPINTLAEELAALEAENVQLRAALNDLIQKLEAAQAELHELRIRVAA